jgi:hypothetical protein
LRFVKEAGSPLFIASLMLRSFLKEEIRKTAAMTFLRYVSGPFHPALSHCQTRVRQEREQTLHLLPR